MGAESVLVFLIPRSLRIAITDSLDAVEILGVSILCFGGIGFYDGETETIGARVEETLLQR